MGRTSSALTTAQQPNTATTAFAGRNLQQSAISGGQSTCLLASSEISFGKWHYPMPRLRVSSFPSPRLPTVTLSWHDFGASENVSRIGVVFSVYIIRDDLLGLTESGCQSVLSRVPGEPLCICSSFVAPLLCSLWIWRRDMQSQRVK